MTERYSSPIRRLGVVVAIIAIGVVSLISGRPTVAAAAGTTPLDCADWRYGPADEPASLPGEFDRDDYRRTSLRDPALADSPHNLCGQMGSAVDLAWGLTQGSPDVVIAILDSGIRWRNVDYMSDLADKAHINLGEAKPSCYPAVPDGDCNGDGVFDLGDFGALADRNGNGVVDPEDLILDPAYSDGVDDDGNGYVDDIAGWDFLFGDNNAFDTVDYGHGSGEADDSVANANGSRDVGTCPKCQFIPVRVGDSFIADGQRFAAGVLFALDSGARVIQEALGAITNPSAAQTAIDAAYARDVVVVASMADEASKHPNLPGALEHTLAVNSVTRMRAGLLQDGSTTGYLALNGCTNFGGRTFVAVPSSSCSSEATGIMSGVVGLVESAADAYGVDLSADEVMQIVRATADDIDFSTPNAHDPANDFGTPAGGLIADTVRYPSRPGWDATFGYGRINAYEMIKAVRDTAIPPEAMIDSPEWLQVADTTGTLAVTGHVGAPRADSFDYELQWAPGLQPPAYPATDTWYSAGGSTGLTAPVDGTLGTLDLATIAAALPDGGHGAPIDPSDANRPDEERFSVRIRVVVHAHGGDTDGATGEMQKQIFVHDDPDLVAGFPKRIPGAGSASQRFVDLDRDGVNELLVATNDGTIHAYRAGGSELPGFPVAGDPSPFWPTWSAAGAAAGVSTPSGAFVLGAPAVGDLDGDGALEVIAADVNGGVYVWSATGARLATMRTNPAWSQDDAATQDEYNRTQPGFLSAPALGDLDGDGSLEIVAAAMDRHVYAWHADGSTVEGFPVLVVDPDTPTAVDPTSHKVTFDPASNPREGGALVVTPTLADLDGDGLVDIVVGAQEEYRGAPGIGGEGSDIVALLSAAADPGTSRVFAISSHGTTYGAAPAGSANPDAGAYLPGWPVHVPMVQTEALPTIGDGIAMPAAVGDLVPSLPGPEVAVASATGPLMVHGADGTPAYGSTATGAVPPVWAAGLGNIRAGQFGAQRNSDDLAAVLVAFAGPAIGDLSGDGSLDIAAPTLGISRMLDISLNDLQPPNDDQVMAWNGKDGTVLDGFPQTIADMSFFVQPAIADLDGDGRAEVVSGNGVYTLNAFGSDGASPSGWPKLTGGWSVGTPAVGDWDGDGTMEVAQVRRDGTLLVWHTRSDSEPQWPSFNCNDANTGAITTTCSSPRVEPPSSTTTIPAGATTVPGTTVPETTSPGTTLPSGTTTPAPTIAGTTTTVPGSPGTTSPVPTSTGPGSVPTSSALSAPSSSSPQASVQWPGAHDAAGPPSTTPGPAVSPASGPDDGLPATGARIRGFLVVGCAFVAAGIVLEAVRRRMIRPVD